MIKTRTPNLDLYDLFVRNFFDGNDTYTDVSASKLIQPVDIKITSNELIIEIACVGVEKEDVEIFKSPGIIRIKYMKPDNKESQDVTYIQRRISKSSFDLGYKIGAKYDVSKLEASLEKGLLTITIPVHEDEQPKKVLIN